MKNYKAIPKFRILSAPRLSVLLIMLISGIACRKFVQVSPPSTELATASVYANNNSAASTLTGIYDNLYGGATGGATSIAGGANSISVEMGLAADELTNYTDNTSALSQFYTNSLTSISAGPNSFWTSFYQYMYDANASIAGLNNSTGLTPAVKQQLIGEAEFLRAFLNFYGVNLFGNFPLVTTTDYHVNNTLHRTEAAQVYQQIIVDLKDAQAKLSGTYLSSNVQGNSSDRLRPTKWAAAALLARTYLYTNDWVDAEAEADTVLNNTQLYHLSALNSVFLKNSSEAIWQLVAVVPGYNTYDGNYFVLTGVPGNGGTQNVALSTYLLSSFEAGDQRLSNWVDSIVVSGTAYYFPYKYKVYTVDANNPITEYQMVLRLAEQYLIRAEARAQQGNLAGAIADLNIIRSRAGLANTIATTQGAVLNAIYHERQVELFTEWGDRWFNLKRSGSINNVMSVVTPQKGGQWNSDWILLPIPQSEILINGNLSQNPGY